MFSDAHEGRQPHAPSVQVPITRVEMVDDAPSYGQVPGTAAYNMRTEDAPPDIIAVIPDGERSRSSSRTGDEDRPMTPGGTPVPKMVLRRVDAATPSHGEVPGTAAHEFRMADAVPDEIFSEGETEEVSPVTRQNEGAQKKVPIPRTVVTRVDSKPSHGEVPGTDAYKIRVADAEPDVMEKKGDVPGKYQIPGYSPASD